MPERTALKPVVFRGDSLHRLRAFPQVARREGGSVYVLLCFQKKTEKTAKADLKLARARYRELMRGVK